MISVFNEKTYAEKIMKYGFLSYKIQFELKILAKYFKFVEEKPPKEVKEALIAFCERFMHGFNLNIHYSLINSTMNYLKSKKCKFIVIENIFVSEEFMQYFVNLDEDGDIKKFLFTLAVFGKIHKEIGYSEKFVSDFANFRSLRQSAGVKMYGSVYDNLNDLYNKGFLKMTSKSTINLLFLDNIPEGEPRYKIGDFQNLGLVFDIYTGVKRRYCCVKCGQTFEKKQIKRIEHQLCNDCLKKKLLLGKKINCVDCGKIVFLSSKNVKTSRCEDCQKNKDKEKYSKYNEKRKKNTT